MWNFYLWALFISVNALEHAFYDKIDICLFNRWTIGKTPVLKIAMKCNGHDRAGLCYAAGEVVPINSEAQFAVCYNKKTLIPEFTGHVVHPKPKNGPCATGRDAWRDEGGQYAPNPKSNEHDDYEKTMQSNILGKYYNDSKQYFFARGHLTPNDAFCTSVERKLTMINTNIAPQWQKFNTNWVVVESAVKKYSNRRGRPVYVVTGTAGKATSTDGTPLKLNGRVTVPKYFWKAVCDPSVQSSLIFVAENPTGPRVDEIKGGCNGYEMIRGSGIIHCYSLSAFKDRKEFQRNDFKLPSFGDTCQPSKKGTFLDDYLKGLSNVKKSSRAWGKLIFATVFIIVILTYIKY